MELLAASAEHAARSLDGVSFGGMPFGEFGQSVSASEISLAERRAVEADRTSPADGPCIENIQDKPSRTC